MAVVSDRSAVFVCLPIECAWHRVAVCSAHGCAGSIASPRRGGTALRTCSTTWARMATAAAANSAAWELLARACNASHFLLALPAFERATVDASQMC